MLTRWPKLDLCIPADECDHTWQFIYNPGLNINGCPTAPDRQKNFKRAEGQVNIRVCLPYMAGKISSREIQYSFNSTDKAIAGKQLISTSKVDTEKSLSCSFNHTFCRTGQNCVWQGEIKVYLPYLANAFKS